MFKIIFQILFIIYIIFVIFNILEIQRYNLNGMIKVCNNQEDTITNLKNLNPVILENINTLTYDNLNIKENQGNFIRKKGIIDNMNGYNSISKGILENNNKLPLYYKDSITFYKDEGPSYLLRCIHKYNFINVMDGMTIIYLINPKHKHDIINKDTTGIKKWAHKKILQKGDEIIIPSNWYYFIESNEGVVLHHTDVDNYFTLLPILLKEYYLESGTKPDWI